MEARNVPPNKKQQGRLLCPPAGPWPVCFSDSRSEAKASEYINTLKPFLIPKPNVRAERLGIEDVEHMLPVFAAGKKIPSKKHKKKKPNSLDGEVHACAWLPIQAAQETHEYS